eukprot:11417400-Karenia_brevis.AAC.1
MSRPRMSRWVWASSGTSTRTRGDQGWGQGDCGIEERGDHNKRMTLKFQGGSHEAIACSPEGCGNQELGEFWTKWEG